jgi:hypothetical protein
LAEKENSSFGRFFWALMGGTDGKTIVSLRLPSAPSRKMADGKTAQDGARRSKTAQYGTDGTDGADGAPTKPATLSARNGMKIFFQFVIPGWIG